MNNTSRRAYAVYGLVVLFLAGLIFLVTSVAMNAEKWALNRANQHLYTAGQITSAGQILDKKGTVLAKTKDGKRIFNDSSSIRRATLHIVGDTAGYISTGVHTIYKSELTGYSFVNGVYLLNKYGEGNNVHLTIDADLCAYAYDALIGRKGTIGVYNYKTGEILCMVSSPNYDPYNKPNDIDTDKSGKYDGIYLNRFLSGVFTPGSTFKVITAASAIENIPDIYSRTYQCKGKLQTANGVVVCHAVHGKVNFKRALNVSCNSAFAEIAIELGTERLTATAKALGFGSGMMMNGTATAKSQFDLSKANELDLGWAGIGQYTTLANPYHMLTIMGAIANNGTAVKPYLVGSLKSPAGTVIERGKTTFLEPYMTSETANKLKEMMRSNVKDYYGEYNFKGLEFCGKTGTAEVGDNKKPHAWFVGFSQKASTPYAIVVVVENGGSGIGVAAPLANKVMQKVVTIK